MVDIIFKGRRTEVQDRFRSYASAKLGKIEKLDHKAIRVDVEVSAERNPRLAGQRERVELTIRSRGPVIRAEAAADDRFAALDRALAKLEERLRRTGDRRKEARHGLQQAERIPGLGRIAGLRKAGAAGTGPLPAIGAPGQNGQSPQPGRPRRRPVGARPQRARATGSRPVGGVPGEADGQAMPPPRPDDWAEDAQPDAAGVVPIQMEGDCPVVVREKHHHAVPMSVDQALLEMELVGHDFYLFRDEQCGLPSVVYRRHGYNYGLIRLVEHARKEVPAAGSPTR
jgi:ribosomal subunit interface protein